MCCVALQLTPALLCGSSGDGSEAVRDRRGRSRASATPTKQGGGWEKTKSPSKALTVCLAIDCMQL